MARHSPTESSPLLARSDSVEDDSFNTIRPWASFKLVDLLRFIGPGFMVGVGYLDPGNWATDLAAGSEFAYSLLYIILIANLMAIVLQYLCIKLGTVTGQDLATACRTHFSPQFNMFLFIISELAIIATDLAEVIGTAIALNLLFGISLTWGVALTALDVLVVLSMYGADYLQVYENGIMVLLGIVAACFVVLVKLSQPDWSDVFWGFIPSDGVFKVEGQLYIAMGIIGATIMPHNLYLHSSIVRHRSNTKSTVFGEINEITASSMSMATQPLERRNLIPKSLFYSNIDSVIALSIALLINSSILVVASASFHDPTSGTGVADLTDAYNLLLAHFGYIPATLFAVALFCAGMSSTITGTLAGQIVTEGFLGEDAGAKFNPAVQRLFTRLLAIVPAMIAAIVGGNSGMSALIVASQVVLSFQLPFAIWPLVWITGGGSGFAKGAMKVVFSPDTEEGTEPVVVDFANSFWLQVAAIVIAVLITIFNLVLLWQMLF